MRTQKTLFVALVVVLLVVALAPTAVAKTSVGGKIKWLSGVSAHYGATHHGDSKPTFKDGVWLKVCGKKCYTIHVVDTCAGSGCVMLDVSDTGFKKLGWNTSQGVGTAKAYCGKTGNKDIKKCLAGEDKSRFTGGFVAVG